MAVLILAGCGGSSASNAPSSWQTVKGSGFTFKAPAGWKVHHAQAQVSAVRDSELVQVSTFSLQKPYSAKLFGRVAIELHTRMQDVARQTGGKLGGERTVTAGGIRSHAYDVTAGDHVDQYTFVLSGRREYLLLCRRRSSSSSGFCTQLETSFARR